MKNKRTVLTAFLLIATLTFGIGYATLTDALTLNGTGNITQTAAEDAFDEKLYFSSAVANRAADGDSASIITSDPDIAGFTVKSLAQKDDSTTFTFTITNESDLDAWVSPTALTSASNTHPAIFSLVSDWNGQTRLIEAGQSLTYTLTVTCLETPQVTIDASFQIVFNASTENPNP